ncbi:MAG TPA: DUF4439 domain-containing protein [Actinomycetales bacterium]|nr:DUF4439 domain-containing protein [Actinomycetales bacterium]
MPAVHPSRRGVLRGGLVGGMLVTTGLVTAGCGLDLGRVRFGEQPPPPSPAPGADELARRRAAESAVNLQAVAAASLGARPDLEPLLTAVVAAHAAHGQALGPPATPSATSTETAPTVDPLAELLRLESEAAQQALGDATDVSAGLARLLASVGSSRAVHASLLAGSLGQPPTSAPSVGPPSTAAPAVEGAAAEALVTALDGEYAAVYTFGVIAARLADAQRERAVISMEAHDLVVERLSHWLAEAELDVPPSAPAYQVPALASAADAVALATSIEEQVAVLDASLVAAATGDLRAAAADLLVQRALAASAWRGAGVPFPGLPELA